jgi:uncharacterized membrane protein YbhN (UPF0104 family)
MLASLLRRRLPVRTLSLVVAGITLVAVMVVQRSVDWGHFTTTLEVARSEPVALLVALGCFGIAFGVRALAWTRVLRSLSFSHALAGIHLSLGANHVLPLRLGEPARVVSVVRRAGQPLDAALASTVSLRLLDMASIVVLGLVVAPAVFVRAVGPLGWGVAIVGLVASVAAWRWLRSVAERRSDVLAITPSVIALALVAWLLESVLTYTVAGWAGVDLTWSGAVLVTTLAVAAQIVAITPGGFGTYEAAAVAGYVALGVDARTALGAALAAHALKTAYSLVVGAIAMWAPAPGLIGRLRLQRDVAERASVRASEPDAPVLLFMPAFNEEASVHPCLERVPATVLGRRVEVLVVDDGSSDRTVEIARAAGAEVYSLPQNRGLGAAVREGLRIGVEREVAATVFCDADGEYPPEELANLVRPILAGEADYVVGSRFLGNIEHMRPHRRFGNLVLTRVLSVVARRRISDGQTGYRAFSPAAAGAAEVIHDFNYAQVLTLDLLAKGFRYVEVPISYRFRTAGDSFIRLGPYLRRVVPAIYREVNAPSVAPSAS